MARRDQSLLGMLPAHQRFETGDPAVIQREDRLVVDAQLVAFDGAVQLTLQVQVFGGKMAHARVETAVAAASGCLGPIQRDVRLAQ